MKARAKPDARRIRRIKAKYAAAFAIATKAELIEGAAWYDTARNDLKTVSLAHRVPFDVVVGICAALSPRLRWSLNVVYTDWVIQGIHVPHITSMVNKAKRILETGNVSLITAPKTSAFYANLMGDYTRVTVDRWMYRLAGFDVSLYIPDVHYTECEQAVIQLSNDIGYLNPAQLQAVLWLIARR